jgi:hypothetical protein
MLEESHSADRCGEGWMSAVDTSLRMDSARGTLRSGGGAVAVSDVTERAERVAGRLAVAWGEDFMEAAVDSAGADLVGLALAHALSKKWIEPDEWMSPYLENGERVLNELTGGEQGDGDDD